MKCDCPGERERKRDTEPAELSIVLPVFNEMESLEPLFVQIEQAVRELDMRYEVIFVDDGSTDGSAEVLETLHRDRPDAVKVLHFRRNFGKAAALSVGFDKAEGEVVVTMDADLQDDPAEIPRLLAKMEEGYDLVSGWKRDRKDPIGKTVPSRIFNTVTSWISGIKLHDFNCGLKAYRRAVVQDLDLYGELHRYIPVLAYGMGYRVGEVPVRHHPRRFGKTKYGSKRFLSGFLDLLTVLSITRYTMKPLHLFGGVGALLVALGLIVDGYLSYLRFRYGSIKGHYPLLMLGTILLIVGIQFVSTGLLAEMIVTLRGRGERQYSVWGPDETNRRR